jgi:hypothetical protein
VLEEANRLGSMSFTGFIQSLAGIQGPDTESLRAGSSILAMSHTSPPNTASPWSQPFYRVHAGCVPDPGLAIRRCQQPGSTQYRPRTPLGERRGGREGETTDGMFGGQMATLSGELRDARARAPLDCDKALKEGW